MFAAVKKVAFLSAFVLASSVSFGGCVFIGEEPGYQGGSGGPPPWAPAHGHRAKHPYQYYPASQVYFDPVRSVYFYMGGRGWQVSAALPTGIHLDMADYVSLEMETDHPYEYHADVVKKYPPGQMRKLMKGKGKNKWY